VIPPERIHVFLTRVRVVRALQTEYRRTIDPILRRKMEREEVELDAAIGWLAADLAAELPAAELSAGEGGVA
jgi:hypothetical protein